MINITTFVIELVKIGEILGYFFLKKKREPSERGKSVVSKWDGFWRKKNFFWNISEWYEIIKNMINKNMFISDLS